MSGGSAPAPAASGTGAAAAAAALSRLPPLAAHAAASPLLAGSFRPLAGAPTFWSAAAQPGGSVRASSARTAADTTYALSSHWRMVTEASPVGGL